MHEWVGTLAESWELIEPDTVIYNIRKGVYWHDKPPTNGRELTAEDVASSLDRLFTLEGSPHKQRYGHMYLGATVTDRWTVELKSTEGDMPTLFRRTCDYATIQPPDAMEEYGYALEPESVIGTGPFILVDLVPGSSASYERNSNYWGTDPLHPDNQLPYLDGVKWLYIPDISTRVAALRTGKVDWLNVIGWEDSMTLMKTHPQLGTYRILEAAHQNIIWARLDKPELPFHDVRIRRALALALDQQAIVKDYYGGNAELFSTPIAGYPELLSMFIPLEELSEEIQELYQYKPEKAKQLLAEAGYPDGFKTSIVCHAPQVDLLSIVKDYWSRVGVDLTLDVKEFSVWRSVRAARKHEEMIFGPLYSVAPYSLHYANPKTMSNSAMIDDPLGNETLAFIEQNAMLRDDECAQKLREFTPYALGNVWWIETPSPYLWSMWQPWLKAYHGEKGIGLNNWFDFPKYVWYDQDLKEEMTGRR